MPLVLELYIRNPDGSLTWGAWWVLATVSVVWFTWGLSVAVWPRWITKYLRVSSRGRSGVVLRLIGVVVGAVGIVVAMLVLRAMPSKLY